MWAGSRIADSRLRGQRQHQPTAAAAEEIGCVIRVRIVVIEMEEMGLQEDDVKEKEARAKVVMGKVATCIDCRLSRQVR